MSPETPCGNCAHPFAEHNEHGDCGHYDRTACWCFAFVKPEDATPEMRARLLFGRMFHSTLTFKTPFVPGGPCQRDGCPNKAERRIMTNIWGTVCEYDVCVGCGEIWHGKLVDDFPAKGARRPGATA